MTILPDVLERDLRAVFCGTAVGPTSARLGAYFAASGNRFWDVLQRVGLTPRKLQPREYHELVKYGIGLTDLAKKRSGTDQQVAARDFDTEGLRAKIKRYGPKALAFNGKTAAVSFLGHPVSYGRQPMSIGNTVIFVLPSTSGSARGYWDESYWLELAKFVRSAGVAKVERQVRQTRGSDEGQLVEKAQKVDRLVRDWLGSTGVAQAKPKDVMPLLVRRGIFSKDHREGLPLRKLLRELDSRGLLGVMTTASFEQKRQNKIWYFTLAHSGTKAR